MLVRKGNLIRSIKESDLKKYEARGFIEAKAWEKQEKEKQEKTKEK